SSCVLYLSFTHPSNPPLHTPSLHDALPISRLIASTQCGGREKAPHPPTREGQQVGRMSSPAGIAVSVRTLATAPLRSGRVTVRRSEEHTSELQSRFDLVCRLLLEKKK